MKQCAFCDAKATTGEHLWDDWINRQIPKTRFNAKKRLSLESLPIQFVSVGLRERVPVVCEDCNSGWMSTLTERMRGRFSEAILQGSAFSLDLTDASVLAALTLLKAAVKDYGYNDDVFFTRAARERLRTGLVIPDLVKVWVAACQGSARYLFHSSFRIVSTSVPGPLDGMEFFSYTYILGKLALQLLAPRWKNLLHRGRPLVTLVPNVYWDAAAVQFWPFAGTNLSWPPEKYLGESVIEQFVSRFQMPINVPL